MNKTKAQSHYAAWYERNKERAREQKRIEMRKLRALDPQKYAEQSRRSKAKQRERLFEMYGHACSVCGFDDKRALTLDHKQNNGNEERKQIGDRGVYKKAKENYLPNEYRILCMNCQFITRIEARKSNQHK